MNRYLFSRRPAGTVTAEEIRAAGMNPAPLETVTVPLTRLTAAGKWHVQPAAVRAWGSHCPHLDRAAGYGRNRLDLPAADMPVLAHYDLCMRCAAAFEPRGPAGAYWRAAVLLVRAAAWVAQLEQVARAADWLDYSRWTAVTPFGPPDLMDQSLDRLKGARGWAAPRADARNAWLRLHQRAEAAWQEARTTAGPPGFRVRAASARDELSRCPDIRRQSLALAAITGDTLPACPDPWASSSRAWLRAAAEDGPGADARAALAKALDDLLGGRPVRDVSLLPCPPSATGGLFCSPAQWAQHEFRTLLARVAAVWAGRLETALEAYDHDRHADAQRLLLVIGWPLLSSAVSDIAYITQFPQLASGPVFTGGRYSDHGRPATAVVLRVPAWAAHHAGMSMAGCHDFISAAAPAGNRDQELRAAWALLRQHSSLFVAQEAVDDPPGLPEATVRARAAARRRACRPEFEAWCRLGTGDSYPPGNWIWVPGDSPADAAADGAVLGRLAEVWRLTVEITVMAGPGGELTEETFPAYLADVDAPSGVLRYQTELDDDAPAYDIPLRRLVKIAEWR